MSELYNRQKDLGINQDTSLTIVGCGGIGFWVSKFAAMSGIPKMYLFDNDVIEESNLNRIDLPLKFLGRNKADMTAMVVRTLRPDCEVSTRPFILKDFNYVKTDWLVDCTDRFESQQENQKIARNTGTKYLKAGYDSEAFSINDSVAEWDVGETQDGYITTPSWVVPASVVAALTVAKIMKYENAHVENSIKNIMSFS